MNGQIETLRRFVATRDRVAHRSQGGHVVVVGSGKGGVGTSVISALLALGAAAAGTRTLLVDGDEGLSSLHLLFGLDDAGPGVAALRGGGAAPDELLVPLTDSLVLLPRRGDVAEVRLGLAEERALFRRIASLYERFELVVIDGGSRLDSVLGALAPGADRLVAVTTEDRIAAAATYALIKTVFTHHGALPVGVVANRCDSAAARSSGGLVRAAAKRFLAEGAGAVEVLGAVPDDQHLSAAVAQGLPLSRVSEAPAVQVTREIAHRLRQGMKGAARPRATLSAHG